MVDIETADNLPSSAIGTIGACIFRPFDTPGEVHGEHLIRVDIEDCLNYGLTMGFGTMSWWANQSEDARHQMFTAGPRFPLKKALEELTEFYDGCWHVWGNGSVFDVSILENAYRAVGMEIPWNFWQIRDVRTIFDLGEPLKPVVTAHTALTDAKAQAKSIQHIYRELKS